MTGVTFCFFLVLAIVCVGLRSYTAQQNRNNKIELDLWNELRKREKERKKEIREKEDHGHLDRE